MYPTPLHFECVVCHDRAANEDEDAEAATLIVLTMLLSGARLEDVHRDLCFVHRRRVEDNAKEMPPVA
jgi:intergrase/recombinase